MSDWLAADRTDLAAERILDAAGALFTERGVAAVGMADVARSAGCSRATLYRYFGNRHALQLAFVDRETRLLAKAVLADVEDVQDPGERIVETVEAVLARVRTAPALVVWFRSDSAGIATEMASSSAVIEGFAAAFFAGMGMSDTAPNPVARWLIRVTVSLLSMPGADAAEERALLEQFVVPSVLGGRIVRR